MRGELFTEPANAEGEQAGEQIIGFVSVISYRKSGQDTFKMPKYAECMFLNVMDMRLGLLHALHGWQFRQ